MFPNIPRCEKCGKEYHDGTKSCSEDGDKSLQQRQKKWHIVVMIWLIFALIAKLLVLMGNFVGLSRDLHYSYMPGVLSSAITVACTLVALFATMMLLRKKKIGFSLLVIAAIVSDISFFAIGAFPSAEFRIPYKIISIGIWCAMLQIKRDGISAWNTLI